MRSRLGSLDLVKGIGGQHGDQLTLLAKHLTAKRYRQNKTEKELKGGEAMYNFLVYKMYIMHEFTETKEREHRAEQWGRNRPEMFSSC